MRILFVVLAAALMVLPGCASPRTFPTAPPCVVVEVADVAEPNTFYGGQGVWVGDRVLTVAHLFTDGERDFGALSVVLQDLCLPISNFRSGNLEAVRRGESTASKPEDWAGFEDWAAFQAPFAAPAAPMVLGDGAVRVREKLYVVGYNPLANDGKLLVVPVYVSRWFWRIDGKRVPMPERTFVVVEARRDSCRLSEGWSGSFVGRYDKRSRRWEYVGQLIGGAEASDGRGRIVACHAVMRPPEDVLRWLMDGDGPDAAEARPSGAVDERGGASGEPVGVGAGDGVVGG